MHITFPLFWSFFYDAAFTVGISTNINSSLETWRILSLKCDILDQILDAFFEQKIV